MPTLSIAEFPGEQLHGYAGLPRLPAIATQVVEFDTAGAVSAPFDGATTLIRVLADAPCAIDVSSAPTQSSAMPTSLRLAAGIPEAFYVTSGTTLSVVEIVTHGPPPAKTAKKVSDSGRRKKSVHKKPHR